MLLLPVFWDGRLSFADVVLRSGREMWPNYETTTKIVWLLRAPRHGGVRRRRAGWRNRDAGNYAQSSGLAYTVGISNARPLAMVVLFSTKIPLLVAT